MCDIEKLLEIAQKNECKYLLNEPLKNYTTFRIGGNCIALFKINSEKVLQDLIAQSNVSLIPFIVIGRGSNVLIDDMGFNGVVFFIGSDFSSIRLVDGCTVCCSSGLLLSKLSQFAMENNLTGLEFGYGIPASVGGAVFMNAGAYGGEINDVIISCRGIDSKGQIVIFNKNDMELSYRHSIFQTNRVVITEATFLLSKGSKELIKEKMADLMDRRKSKQPLEYPSAGSTFKRPEGSYASLLIEQCGLKGMSVGGAEVSVKHSGFIINKGNATFSDVMQLIDKVKKIVKDETGYCLECEPEIIRYRN